MPHQHTNQLINENSPYLLQHAHNPVQWHAWGNEALQKAKAQNKIILVSIGYSACHWCHVMEKESFEDESIAAIMNQHFINIKIDREERPDLDHIYMDALQAITGSGGWPLNIFLTPDCKPFYGGTYFPPVKAFNLPSWAEVLNGIAQSWVQRKNEIESSAENLVEHLKKSGNFNTAMVPDATTVFTKENCKVIAQNILKQADKEHGGFGKAPKFPQTMVIQYLLQYYFYTQDKEALQHALFSIDKMLAGGIYDQAGGGFARYSTDAAWLAPHFEKMLYDNALLLNIICDAYQITKHKKYKQAIAQTIDFIKKELMDDSGGFYAALDADSEGVEGKFYVWDKIEIENILGNDAAIFCAFYDVSEHGNWEHKNILRVLNDTTSFAAKNNISEDELNFTLTNSLKKLLAVRNKRIKPITDDKILLGWNALMITALCKAAAALGESSYKNLAIHTMDFIKKKFINAGSSFQYLHTYKKGVAKYPAFLDDYAYVIQACIHLQEITSDINYLYTAKELTQFVIENFSEEEMGYFFFTPKNQADIILRKKEIYDGATPSGNSIMAENLFYLSIVFNKPEWHTIAHKNTAALAKAIKDYPTSFGIWASLLLKYTFGVNELVVMGKSFKAIRDELLLQYLPGKILQAASNEENHIFPLLTGKNPTNETLIYNCKQYTCQLPVNSIDKLLTQLKNVIKN